MKWTATERPYFYQPIEFYSGRVLKCAGMASAENIVWQMAKPGMIMLDSYRSDRIHTDTLEPYTGA